MLDEFIICSSADDNYAKPLGILLMSLLKHHRSRAPICFYVIDGGISTANKQKIDQVIAGHPCRIVYLQPPEDIFSGVQANLGYISLATYFRVLMPLLLPESVTKVLYLDPDMLVLDDLSYLWRQDLQGQALMATFDLPAYQQYFSETFGTPAQNRVFNAGVLLIDLNLWRQQRSLDELLHFILQHHNKATYNDQDALNSVFLGHWGVLDSRWNTFADKFWGLPRDASYQAVGIVHFAGEYKPWRVGFFPCPFAEIYRRHLLHSPWRRECPKASRLSDRIKNHIYSCWPTFVWRWLISIKVNTNPS